MAKSFMLVRLILQRGKEEKNSSLRSKMKVVNTW